MSWLGKAEQWAWAGYNLFEQPTRPVDSYFSATFQQRMDALDLIVPEGLHWTEIKITRFAPT